MLAPHSARSGVLVELIRGGLRPQTPAKLIRHVNVTQTRSHSFALDTENRRYPGVTSCIELHMANTEEQELDNQIKQLSAKLTTYKKALTNPHLCQGDYKVLMGNVLWLEAEISELQAQLEIHRLIGKIYHTVAPALLAS